MLTGGIDQGGGGGVEAGGGEVGGAGGGGGVGASGVVDYCVGFSTSFAQKSVGVELQAVPEN